MPDRPLADPVGGEDLQIESLQLLDGFRRLAGDRLTGPLGEIRRRSEVPENVVFVRPSRLEAPQTFDPCGLIHDPRLLTDLEVESFGDLLPAQLLPLLQPILHLIVVEQSLGIDG